MKGLSKKWMRLSTLGLLSALSSSVFAAGYKMEFQSTSVLADAGEAAVIEDAGTNWYNSAGLVYMPHQLVGSAINLFSRTKYTGSVTAPNNVGGASFFDQGSANSYHDYLLPAIHYALPIKNRFAFGLSIVPAWGLAEDYGRSSLVRYQLTRVYTKTIDVAPSIAVKINDQWSLGAGPDFNYFAISERFNANTASGFFGTTGDSFSQISADSWDMGWHIGALWRANECTRFGINYRSKIVMNMSGYSSISGFPATGSPETNDLSIHWVLPPTTSLSAYRDLNSRWAIMGTVAYDQWSTLRNLNIQNYRTVSVTDAYVSIPITLYQGFRNTFDLGIGAHYKLCDNIMLRGNIKYIQTPTGDQYRDITFPDSDKLGVQIGSRYQFNKKLALDLVYGHVFTKTAPIRPTPAVNALTGAAITGVILNGHTTTSLDLIGAQLVWNI